MKGTIHSIRVAGVLLGLVAALACSNSVRAQDAARGKFVLPFDVQWQGKTLPAGEYHFSLPSAQPGGVLFIRDAQDRGKMLVMTPAKERFHGQNALTIVNRGGKQYVSSLALQWIGTLVYSVPNQKRAERERALGASVQLIPVQPSGK